MSTWNTISFKEWKVTRAPIPSHSSRVIRNSSYGLPEQVVEPPTTLADWKDHFKQHNNFHK